MTEKETEAAKVLELYISTSCKDTLESFDLAYRSATRAVDKAATVLANGCAAWHDDPKGDPEGHAAHHAPADEQFPVEARTAVVMMLFERCERVRQEDIVNA